MSDAFLIEPGELDNDLSYAVSRHMANEGELWNFELSCLVEEAVKFHLNWYCLDCHVHTGKIREYYMVTDEVWKVVTEEKGMMCIGCLEKRLGRELTKSDFSDCLLNEMRTVTGSDRLKERLSRV